MSEDTKAGLAAGAAWAVAVGLGMWVGVRQGRGLIDLHWAVTFGLTTVFGALFTVLICMLLCGLYDKVLDFVQAATEALRQRRQRRKERIDAIRDKLDPTGALVNRLDGK